MDTALIFYIVHEIRIFLLKYICLKYLAFNSLKYLALIYPEFNSIIHKINLV